MRLVVLWVSLLLVPQVGGAGMINVVVEPSMVDGWARERAGALAAPARGLDLRFGRAERRLAQNAPDNAEGDDASRAKGDISPYQAQSDRGLSFGFEVKPRSRYGALARKDDVEDPDLDDQLDKLIERPVFGFRGRYRF